MTDPNREKLVGLAERCEQATGPDMALDRDIRRAIQIDAAPANFTHSLDAAMTLVPKGWSVDAFFRGPTNTVRLECLPVKAGASAAAPALALCAAALKARAQAKEANDGPL